MAGTRAKDMPIGARIGKLVILGRAESTPLRQARWRCECDCGNITTPTGANLRRGVTWSCGCDRALTHKRRYAERFDRELAEALDGIDETE